jgi:2-methylisocitrate lyase-like PEP mutase family enzyme
MLAHVKRIAGVVDVPVTADLEGGYGPAVEDAVATVRGAIESGAVGMNFEDSLPDGSLLATDAQSERVRAIRAAGDALGVPFVINARTDVYHTPGTDDEHFAETVARARAYLAAGADCIFVPFVDDGALIGRLAAAIPGSLNVLAGAASPDVASLARLGVKRISLGSGPAAHLLAVLQRIAIDVRDRGTYGFLADRIAHGDLNTLLAPKPSGF